MKKAHSVWCLALFVTTLPQHLCAFGKWMHKIKDFLLLVNVLVAFKPARLG